MLTVFLHHDIVGYFVLTVMAKQYLGLIVKDRIMVGSKA
jgi:hypothetical protein